MITRVAFILLLPVLLLSALWACASLWFDGPAFRPAAGLLVAGFAASSLCLLIWMRPLIRALGAYVLLFALVVAWWLSLEPSHDRDWLPDVAQLPSGRVEGNVLTIENVRNFDYRSETDYTARWETRTYDLSKLRGVDLFLSYWGSPLIAHTFVSWEFEAGPPLTISIETRKEVGESYSTVKGFFRQFELYYVVSDERDVAKLRTNYRGEEVYLYRLRSSPAQSRKLLDDYLVSVNRLSVQAAWYNALIHNCTTGIRQHVKHVIPSNRWDWRVLVNGYLDRSAYERGTINTTLPFDELRKRSHISPRARTDDGTANFSELIREGLPERPAAP